MSQAACQSLVKANALLHRIEKSAQPLPSDLKQELEVASRRLLERFVKTADHSYFTAFYQISQGVFHAYSFYNIRKLGYPLDPQEIANRMYCILFEKLLAPGQKVPLDYLFPWCYRVILNLVREENRNLRRNQPLLNSQSIDQTVPSSVEQLVEKEEEEKKRKRLEQTVDTLYSDKAGLSSRDREIMRRFYLGGQSIATISQEMGLTRANIGVILMRSRQRIARRISRPKSCH